MRIVSLILIAVLVPVGLAASCNRGVLGLAVLVKQGGGFLSGRTLGGLCEVLEILRQGFATSL
jgi:hypothetical protein